MGIPLVDLRIQYQALKPEIDEAIQRVLETAHFVLGEEVERFEQHFAQFCAARFAVGVSSGTDALVLALRACGVGAGDEVLTTPFTFTATAAAIAHVGARPVFVDILPDTYNIDPDRLERAITPQTKAILPVHLYGQPADMDPILAVARRHGLRVIEDACQAHGATYRGRPVGALADVGCFSFYPSKNLGAYGDGGMLVTNDPAIDATARNLRDHGRRGKYEHTAIGYTYRLDGIQAAILDVKLRYLPGWTEARRRNAHRYNELLADTGLALPVEREGSQAVYHCYVVRTPNRDEVLKALQAAGIGAAVHYPIPLHLQPCWRDLGYAVGDFPVAEASAEAVLTLPLYPELTEAQIAEVVARLRATVAETSRIMR